MAAVGAGKVDDELQLLASVVPKLALQTTLFGLGRPHEPLVNIQQTVQRGRQRNQLPADHSIHLNREAESPPRRHQICEESRVNVPPPLR